MLLAIDTATRVASIALYDESGILAEETWHTRNNHSVEVMPAIMGMLARQHLSEDSVACVAVAAGPGSFTGLRIGMSMAKGFCLALDIPIIAIPTLEITAYATGDPGIPVVAVLEAGRRRISVGTFVYKDGFPVQQGELGIYPSAQWEPDLSEPVLITGEVDKDVVERLLALPNADNLAISSLAASLRRAGFLAELAWERLQDSMTDDLDTVSPLYLRRPGSGSAG